VQPLLDRAMLICPQLDHHPLINAAITTIAAADLTRLIEASVIDPGFSSSPPRAWPPAERPRGAAGWPPPRCLRLALAVKPHQQT
jgi:hypothetical protein